MILTINKFKNHFKLISYFIFLLIFFIFPSFLHSIFKFSHSDSFFIAFSIFSISSIAAMRLRNIKINSFYSKKLKYILITIILIITHGALINNFTSDFDISRFFFSIIYLACMLFSAFLVFLLRNKFSDINFLRAATFFCYFLIVIGYLAFFGFNISGAAGKPIFYFDEPWKFAAAFSPFFLFRLIKARDPEKILLAALAFNIGNLFFL